MNAKKTIAFSKLIKIFAEIYKNPKSILRISEFRNSNEVFKEILQAFKFCVACLTNFFSKIGDTIITRKTIYNLSKVCKNHLGRVFQIEFKRYWKFK